MSFDIPSNVILPVDTVDVVLDRAPHPFETENTELIKENWQLELQARPAIFDGTVVLLSEFGYAERRLYGRCHAVRYATFMYWRRERAGTAAHAFAHPILVTSDNALVAIRMAAHTVNAGKVYFAAGSFEPEDFPGGQVDLHCNMAREVLEETGIDLAGARREQGCHALSTDKGTVIFRRYHLDMPASEVASRIAEFVAGEREPEIDGPVVIRAADDLPDGLMPHMKPLIGWHFGNPFKR